MAEIEKRKRKNGYVYRIRVVIGRKENNAAIYRQTTFRPTPGMSAKGTRLAVQRFADKFEAEVRHGHCFDSKITLKEFSDEWIEKYAQHEIEETTLSSYEDILRLHILPKLGNLKMADISPATIAMFQEDLMNTQNLTRPGQTISAGTVRRVMALLSSMLSTAVTWEVIDKNPCANIKPPKMKKARDTIRYFDLDQAQRFLDFIETPQVITVPERTRKKKDGTPYKIKGYTKHKELESKYRVFFLLALFCGCRRGELLALTRDDVDLENRTLNISKSTEKVRGQVITKDPKSETSIRVVPIPPSVIDVLRRYRKEQLEYRFRMGTAWKGGDKLYLFTKADGSQMHPDTPSHKFHDLVAAYNRQAAGDRQLPADAVLPEIPLHGLRHTNATLMVRSGADVKTISSNLGHSSVSVTMDIYAHSLAEAGHEAAEKFDSLIHRKDQEGKKVVR